MSLSKHCFESPCYIKLLDLNFSWKSPEVVNRGIVRVTHERKNTREIEKALTHPAKLGNFRALDTSETLDTQCFIKITLKLHSNY